MLQGFSLSAGLASGWAEYMRAWYAHWTAATSETEAIARTSIVGPGHRKFPASSLTTMTDVTLNPANSGMVTSPTAWTHRRSSSLDGLVSDPLLMLPPHSCLH